jgi:hypothetical protein
VQEDKEAQKTEHKNAIEMHKKKTTSEEARKHTQEERA